jgi:hypothetical protein
MSYIRLEMKKNWKRAAIVAALCILFGGMTNALAQNAPIAGGYGQASVRDPEVVAAARFAVREQGRKEGGLFWIDAIRSAEVQVVAGLNYKLSMIVTGFDTRKPRYVTAVVYKNLKREYSLSSWEVGGEAPSDLPGSGYVYSSAPVEQLMEALDKAYTDKALGRLDARRPYAGRVRIVISHSLMDDDDPHSIERRQFRTLAQAERWLKSRERGGLPNRQTRPLLECKRGTCEYDFDGGILHNQLYLQSVDYGLRRGRPYIKTIYLLDGD